MFAYCGNNPVRYSDPSGKFFVETLVATVGAEWAVTIIVGGIVIVSGLVFQTVNELAEWISNQWYRPSFEVNYAQEQQLETVPDVTYPGDDPQKAPDGTEWKGKGSPGGKDGNYYNKSTGESYHPDLDHPEPIGPHWDYNFRGSGCSGWRIFPDGSVVPKASGVYFVLAY